MSGERGAARRAAEFIALCTPWPKVRRRPRAVPVRAFGVEYRTFRQGREGESDALLALCKVCAKRGWNYFESFEGLPSARGTVICDASVRGVHVRAASIYDIASDTIRRALVVRAAKVPTKAKRKAGR